MRRGALTMIAAVLLVFGAGQAAQAQYGPSVRVDFNGDGTITLTLDNCVEGETVTFDFNGAVQTDICENGSASVVFGVVRSFAPTSVGTVVGSESGVLSEFTVDDASGATTPPSQSDSVDALPATGSGGLPAAASSGLPAAGSSGLPATGSSGIDSATTIAVGLLVVGVGMFGVARSRRRPATA